MQRIRLVLLLLVAAFFASGTSLQAQSNDAATVVNAFYTAYFSRQPNWTELSRTRQYLTPSFAALLQKTVTAQKDGAVLDFDPFINAQEEPRSFSVGTPSGSATTASIPVRIMLAHGGGSGLRVVTRRTSSGWKIDNFIYPQIGDLRHILAKALK